MVQKWLYYFPFSIFFDFPIIFIWYTLIIRQVDKIYKNVVFLWFLWSKNVVFLRYWNTNYENFFDIFKNFCQKWSIILFRYSKVCDDDGCRYVNFSTVVFYPMSFFQTFPIFFCKTDPNFLRKTGKVLQRLNVFFAC